MAVRTNLCWLLLIIATAPTLSAQASGVVDLSEVPGRFIVDAEPPRASGRVTAPVENLSLVFSEDTTLFEVARRLEIHLRQAGHSDLGWFYVHPEGEQSPGFAVVAKPQTYRGEGVNSLWERVKYFFVGRPPINRRVMALYFTEPPFARAPQEPSAEYLMDWQVKGSSAPFEAMRRDDVTSHRLTALIYVVQESPTTGAWRFVPSVDEAHHIKDAGLQRLFAAEESK